MIEPGQVRRVDASGDIVGLGRVVGRTDDAYSTTGSRPGSYAWKVTMLTGGCRDLDVSLPTKAIGPVVDPPAEPPADERWADRVARSAERRAKLDATVTSVGELIDRYVATCRTFGEVSVKRPELGVQKTVVDLYPSQIHLTVQWDVAGRDPADLAADLVPLFAAVHAGGAINVGTERMRLSFYVSEVEEAALPAARTFLPAAGAVEAADALSDLVGAEVRR